MMESFSDRLRSARERRRLSQSELADQTGFQPSAISHFEAGRRRPSVENLKRLADALDVSADYLLGRVPSMEGPHFSVEDSGNRQGVTRGHLADVERQIGYVWRQEAPFEAIHDALTAILRTLSDLADRVDRLEERSGR